ncbi:ubiquitin thioesterase ZRANB1-like [Saccoglossus kowalevskii]|uniref:ubiquitinyl hydrolase 1 n=1 Tax=Saccoglossus kowalevskii TaxID=10224 RepID=A0ABM0MD08_SACKO|nr:PREDICTED: ubiquitin thioesterase ZRANB1-like [Saccoglossus kowalevskii]
MGDSRKWTCEYCTYLNWPSAVKCTLCRAPKPLHIIPPETSSSRPDVSSSSSPLICDKTQVCENENNKPGASRWSCKSCTYLNWPKAINCMQCHSPKGGNIIANESGSPRSSTRRKPPTSPDSDKSRSRMMKWNCSACTYDNWPRSKKCVLCHTARDKIKTDAEQASTSSDYDDNKRNIGNGITKTSPTLPTPIGASGIQTIELAAAAGIASASSSGTTTTSSSSNYEEDKEHRRVKLRKRMRKSDWLFLNACIGVVDNDIQAVEAYLTSGGDPGRQLTQDEINLLNRTSAFDVGFTLVHLAIRFQREDLLSVLLTPDVASHALKRMPCHVSSDLATDIRRDIAVSLRQRKGDFPCCFVTDCVTFTLPVEIEDFPLPVRNQLFDEILDRDVQKELEQESHIINWSMELSERLGSRLYSLWNRTAGDCLLDSVLQATWGIFDQDNTLRRALSESLNEGAARFYVRWKDYETIQAENLEYSLDEEQWQQDWAIMLSLASQPGAPLEQTHIFALAHILRRPIIVYGVKFIKSFRGETLGYARFQGVYLPLLWEPGFCWKSPIALGYTRGHFSALVSMDTDTDSNLGAGAYVDSIDDVQVTYLPLTDNEGKLLPVHFIATPEVGTEERLYHDWMDCMVTEGGNLVAQQIIHKRKRPVQVSQMLEEWLERYRKMTRRQ